MIGGRTVTIGCPHRDAVHRDADARPDVQELARMAAPTRRTTTALAHLAILVARLSYEGFFVTLATYAAYVLRRPARLLSAAILATSRLCFLVQTLVQLSLIHI